jgi:hypothetical protein
MILPQRWIFHVAVVAWLLLILASGLAQAQQPSATQSSAIRSNCRSDFMANCSGVTPGGKDALDCLKQNLAKLSAPCQTAVSATMPAPPAAAPAAAAPTPAAAPQTPPAAPPKVVKPATAAKPATAPAAKLSPSPPPPPSPPPAVAAPAVAPLHVRPIIMPERRIAIMAICHADAERLCSGIPPIGPGVLNCLAAQASSLTPNCYDAIARVSMP